MSDRELVYNEPAWKIDVITEINKYVDDKDHIVTRAGGEQTIKKIKKFPDVLLFSDKGLIHGWELKMPDTSIYADDPLKFAIEKANTMHTRSFVLWNASEAALYLKDELGVFQLEKTWHCPNIKTRKDVEKQKNEWVSTLHEIIDSINALLLGKSIKEIDAVDTINDDTYSRYASDLSNGVKGEIKKSIIESRVFEAEVNKWWDYNKTNYPEKSDKIEVLSKVIIIGWMNRFLFAHYLKSHYKVATNVDNITIDVCPVEALKIFEEISVTCDYHNVFRESAGDCCLDSYAWECLIELNNFLRTVKIEKISQENLQSMLNNAVDSSKREVSGQYCTPKELAKLLVNLTIVNRRENILDPCCGTGTIIKEALIQKREMGIKNPTELIWASDKFSYPLKLCTMSLQDKGELDIPVQVFEQDVFNLSPGEKISLTVPKTGEIIVRELPLVGAIVSNLPFVRFEHIHGSNPNIIRLDDKRSDLYGIIALNLKHLLKDGGRAGLIISNSWFGTEWGNKFINSLETQFRIEKVIVSQSGRWFKNAAVVTSILILEKRQGEMKNDEKTQFIAIGERIEHWSERDILNTIVDDIVLGNEKSELVYIQSYTKSEIEELTKYVGVSGLFTDLRWLKKLIPSLKRIGSYFDIFRGERRGWDPLFYPEESTDIEEEYLKPALKSSKQHKRLVIKPDVKAFICFEGESELERGGKSGALEHIRRYENALNETGKPLKEVLRRSKLKWYEMSNSKVADMVISLNPDKRLCVYKPSERLFINQRLIGFKALEGTDVELCHALMNSSVGMFFIEAQGFGRGMGVLDLNETKMKRGFYMLDPKMISSEDRKKILTAFEKLLSRDIKDLSEEIVDEDRILFDKAVLGAFGLEEIVNSVENSLLEIFHIRKAVDVDK